jgi:hypothetical protein
VTQGGRSPNLPGRNQGLKADICSEGVLPHFLLIEPDSSAFERAEGSDDAEEHSASRKIIFRRE